MKIPRMLHVTQSFLPPLEDYLAYLEGIWERRQVTNNGPLLKELERRLASYLEVKHVIAVSNGDAGLRLALRGLGITGEVITTPFSYVSTMSSIIWSGLTPVFADIDKATLTIDPAAVEQAITPRTSAIMATHVYGIPCNVQQLGAVAKKHGLQIIYDAAHAFGVKYEEQGLANFGAVSMVSMHATKLFHTCEGGVLATNNDELAERLEWMRRFGHDGPESFHGVGINAKMSEMHAAMGLCNLKYIDSILAARKAAWEAYEASFRGSEELSLPRWPASTIYNFAYFPLIFPSEAALLRAMQYLAEQNIFPRRYFYPMLNRVAQLGTCVAMPVADDVAPRVLCLPLSAEISVDDIQRVVEAIVGES